MDLRTQMAGATRAGELWRASADGAVICDACAFHCRIAAGAEGVCKVRFNRDGVLYAPWGYVAGYLIEPVEKKPFFHASPGARTLSFGTLGCNLHCDYCQNWTTSQTLRDSAAGSPLLRCSPDALVARALEAGAGVVVATYNEPLIAVEWSVEVMRAAKAHGLLTAFVSNGQASPQVLEYIRPWVDCYKVDLKSFNDAEYRSFGGRLSPVTGTIRRLHDMDFWVEVVTLLVPGLNDSGAELRSVADFLACVSPDIPWHLTAYHKDYRMQDPRNTLPEDLTRAAAIGKAAGLRYVYAGNKAGKVESFESTWCAGCGAELVRRRGYRTLECRIGPDGACPECRRPVPGRWAPAIRQPALLPVLSDF